MCFVCMYVYNKNENWACHYDPSVFWSNILFTKPGFSVSISYQPTSVSLVQYLTNQPRFLWSNVLPTNPGFSGPMFCRPSPVSLVQCLANQPRFLCLHIQSVTACWCVVAISNMSLSRSKLVSNVPDLMGQPISYQLLHVYIVGLRDVEYAEEKP